MPSRSLPIAVRRLATAVAFASAAMGASAEPVSLSVAAFAVSLGNGYGTEASEPGGTKLDASFTAAGFAAPTFTLMNVNDSFTFNLGTFSFNEASVNGQETDGLGLAAYFTFANSVSGVQTIAGSGAAQPGTVNNDLGVDFSVSWAPLTFSFGNGVELGITLNDLAFVSTGSAVQTATVTLLKGMGQQGSQQAIAVPEPGSLALATLALAVLGGNARRSPRQRTPVNLSAS